MNTNNLKTFAKEARLLLLDGVLRQLSFWGFNDKGECLEELEAIEGGYLFRGDVFLDESVPQKWQRLRNKIKNPQSLKDVVEEAAYTWFNRLMAIKILEKNDYELDVIACYKDTKTPTLLQNAKMGNYQPQGKQQQELLREYLLDDDDDKAFALLLSDYCNQHPLLQPVFGKLDDYTELLIPQNLLNNGGVLEYINGDAIPDEDYKEVELIGWLYQFYIADKKDEVFAGFKKNKKARPEDIPAATQIFTPKWIVKYMVENTVGRIWLDHEEDSDIAAEMNYLVQPAEGYQPNEELIDSPKELKLLDPACGSGHILVVGFELLMKIYKEAGYNSSKAVASILEHNLYGLDIDDRAAQLSQFALLMKAAEYSPDILQKGISPNVYAMPESYDFSLKQIQDFLGNDGLAFTKALKAALEEMKQAKNIGSALTLELTDTARSFILERFADLKTTAKKSQLSFDLQAAFYPLKPYLEVLLVLTDQFPVVVANPPYMGSKSMNAVLKKYVSKHYKNSKKDLFAVFMEVCLSLSANEALMAMINQHSWMFLSSYEKLRQQLIDDYSLVNMLHLGPRTFEELSGEVVQSTAFVMQNKANEDAQATYARLVDYKASGEKAKEFFNQENWYPNIPQANFAKIPGSPVAYWVSEGIVEVFENKSIGDDSYSSPGIRTGKDSLFIRFWFEVSSKKTKVDAKNYLDIKSTRDKWYPITRGGEYRKWYGNLNHVINLQENAKELKEKCHDYRLREPEYYFKKGLTWTMIAARDASFRYVPEGVLFGNGGSALYSTDFINIMGFLNSIIAKKILQIINPTLNFTKSDIEKLPNLKIDNDQKNKVESSILISKLDWDYRENSWDFAQNPLITEAQPNLADSYKKWQEKVTSDFFQLHENEEELNRIFIEIYGLEEELTPEVSLKDITILQDEIKADDLEALEEEFRAKGKNALELPIQKEELMRQFLSYAVGCMMGRYHLGKEGLHIAHPKPSEEEIVPYSFENCIGEQRAFEIDDDAIIPMMKDDAFADSITKRIRAFILKIWGESSQIDNLNFLQEALGEDMDTWLTHPNKFWKWHCQKYKKRPIYWLFCSNPKKPHNSAFKVLVYMHRMDKYTVQKIRNQYLHPHQEYLKEQIQRLRDREADLTKTEQKQLAFLEKEEVECQNYDELLKVAANQQIEFDLDDGVKENYKLFENIIAKIP